MDLKDPFIGTVINYSCKSNRKRKYELLSASFQSVKRLFNLALKLKKKTDIKKQ